MKSVSMERKSKKNKTAETTDRSFVFTYVCCVAVFAHYSPAVACRLSCPKRCSTDAPAAIADCMCWWWWLLWCWWWCWWWFCCCCCCCCIMGGVRVAMWCASLLRRLLRCGCIIAVLLRQAFRRASITCGAFTMRTTRRVLFVCCVLQMSLWRVCIWRRECDGGGSKGG